jgi:hypothetical protein
MGYNRAASSTPRAPTWEDVRMSRTRLPAEVAAVLAVVIMVGGTFLPWLQSGSTHRNLYGTAGVVQRLAGLGAPVGAALNALPLLGLFCVLAGVGYGLGWRRTAALSTAVVAAALGSVAVAALVHRGRGDIHIVAAGPTLTLVGATIAVLDLLMLVFAGSSSAPHSYRAPSARTSTMELT